MHCATLDIEAKDEYTLVSFMLSFCRPAGFLSYMPSILRSIALLLIKLCILSSFGLICVLGASSGYVGLLPLLFTTTNRGGEGD